DSYNKANKIVINNYNEEERKDNYNKANKITENNDKARANKPESIIFEKNSLKQEIDDFIKNLQIDFLELLTIYFIEQQIVKNLSIT
ncbi:821_t:CDS:1, partial [Racocetra persica]